MATIHKRYRGKKGVPVKKATGKQIGTVKTRLPSTRQIENRKRSNRAALRTAKKHTRG